MSFITNFITSSGARVVPAAGSMIRRGMSSLRVPPTDPKEVEDLLQFMKETERVLFERSKLPANHPNSLVSPRKPRLITFPSEISTDCHTRIQHSWKNAKG